MRVLSLFTGMGGMDIGFAHDVIVHRDSVPPEWIQEEAGPPGFVRLQRLPFEVVFQNDILLEAKEIADLNGWSHNYHLADIRTLLEQDFPFPEAEVVIGGFPCQDFSHAGKRKGFDSDRGTLYQAFVEVVRRVKPLVFVAENVHGLLTMPGEPIRQIVSDFAAVGYDVTYQLVKCEEFGIPQTRWRVLLFGSRSDQDMAPGWSVLHPSHISCPVGPYVRHLAEPADSDDPAQRIYSKAARLAKGQGQSEVRLSAPGPTIRAEHHGNIEFRRLTGGSNEPDLPERRLTLREAALIQTFPPDCILVNPKTPSSKAYRPIGNAVPPLLGYLVARTVYRGLNPMDIRRFFRRSIGSSPPSTSASEMTTEK